jgi:hypothetical protein
LQAFDKTQAVRKAWAKVPKIKWMVIGTPRPILKDMGDIVSRVATIRQALLAAPATLKSTPGDLPERLKRLLQRLRGLLTKLEEYAEDRVNLEVRKWEPVQGSEISLRPGEPLLNMSMGELGGAPGRARIPFSVSFYKPSKSSEVYGGKCIFEVPAGSRDMAREMASYAIAATLAETLDPPVGSMTAEKVPEVWDERRADRLADKMEEAKKLLRPEIGSIREFTQEFPRPAQTSGIPTKDVVLEGWSLAVPLDGAASRASSTYLMYHDKKDGSIGTVPTTGNSSRWISLISRELAKSQSDSISMGTAHQMTREGLASLFFDVLDVSEDATLKTLDQLIHQLSVGGPSGTTR